MTGAGTARLFVLAIDHRASFRAWSVTVTGGALPGPAVLADLKDVVAQALVDSAVPREEAAILVDAEYGAAAIGRARAAGIRVVVPAERSGQPEFIFEYGDDYARAIIESGGDVVKALVRYNPAGDADRNARSRARLAELGRWCEEAGYPLMLELLLPDVAVDAAERPELTCEAISQLRAAGLDPDWWKLEGQADTARFALVAAATRAGGPARSAGCLVLGRGADDDQVRRWVSDAAAAPGFCGFAIGRSLWTGALSDLLLRRITRTEAVSRISARYAALVTAYGEAAASARAIAP